MVSKILKLLAREGLLASHRGVKGGYSLARHPEEISMAAIIAALEGPIAITECIDETTQRLLARAGLPRARQLAAASTMRCGRRSTASRSPRWPGRSHRLVTLGGRRAAPVEAPRGVQ